MVRKGERLSGKYQSPTSLAPLSRLTCLEEFDAQDMGEPFSLESLRDLARPRVLNLRSTKVASLDPIVGKSIVVLDIRDSAVKDLAPVAGNTQARVLPLFPELVQLKSLDVGYSRFERKQVNAFKKAHPGCEVEYSLNKG